MNIFKSQYMKMYVYVFLIGGFLGVQTVYAALTVCNSGCDYTNIQDAVTDAPDGKVIRIQQGIFTGPITIENKNLTLRGDGSSMTIIDRGPLPSSDPPPPTITVSCTIASSHEIKISNVTISGGAPFHGFGGGGLVNESCVVKLVNTLITNNARRAGGGIGNDGIMLVRNSVISGNGAKLGGGGIRNDGELSITNSFIVGNSVTSGKGGGIDNGGILKVRSSTITENHGPDGGGFANAVGGIARMIDTVIVNNTSIWEGGGLWNVGDLILNRSLLVGNAAGNQGGGVYQKAGGSLKMTNSTLINNLALTTGGGLYAEGTVTEKKTIIQGNTPDNCAGGAFLCP